MKDCLSQEVQTICSSYLAGAKAGVKKDRAILAWLQEAVIGKLIAQQDYLCIVLWVFVLIIPQPRPQMKYISYIYSAAMY